jgi:hypothetical protein
LTDRVEFTAQQTGDTAPEGTQTGTDDQTGTDQRPEWLPEKFKTAEDLAKSYAELEKKLGQRSQEQTQTQQTQQTQETTGNDDLQMGSKEAEVQGVNLPALTEEFEANDGKLTDDTYKRLEKSGFTRTDVDSYIAGQQALAANTRASLLEVAGGEEGYRAVQEWGRANLTQEERDAFDGALKARNLGLAKVALRGIVASYQAANGRAPNLVSGGPATGASAGNAVPFTSRAEMVRVMGTREYKEDPAVRAQVAARLAVTNF